LQGCFKRGGRICEKKGSKAYGILSVLAQAFYDVEYLFTVDENVYSAKVKSGVMRMRRKTDYSLRRKNCSIQ
jgi:16S rRNA (adenine1518-N6/adenine1519-N6)-dimethyltransferase